jgi:hypothetical protein
MKDLIEKIRNLPDEALICATANEMKLTVIHPKLCSAGDLKHLADRLEAADDLIHMIANCSNEHCNICKRRAQQYLKQYGKALEGGRDGGE